MSPRSPDPARVSQADLVECGALLRQGSRTFYAASITLPRGVRRSATALYAFCRLADDAIDLGDTASSRIALARLRDRLDSAYRGRPQAVAADRAFANVVAQFDIPRALPLALLEGFEWDAEGRRYGSMSAVLEYAARVAGSVGAMMSLLMGARSASALARACDLGVAMQLSNIARDVGEDARRGRLYLPEDLLREAGLAGDAFLADPRFSPPLGTVVAQILGAADTLYRRAESGILELPLACRPGMMAARLLYAEIGREVERADFDSVTRRAVVSNRRKAWLLAQAMAFAPAAASESVEPLRETAFLVAAATVAPQQARVAAPEGEPQASTGRNSFEARFVWLIELFERLERLDRRRALERSGLAPEQNS